MTYEEAIKVIMDKQYSVKTTVVFSSETIFAVETQLFKGTQKIGTGLASDPNLTTARKSSVIDVIETIELRFNLK